MANNSKIEWTGETWNPVTGCTKISPGCKNCYAERMSKRLQKMGQEKYKNGFQLTLHKPITTEFKEKFVFVNSMSDLFHEEVPFDFIREVFEIIGANPKHQFQIVTKRALQLMRAVPFLPWPKNLWMGVSVENPDYLWRVSLLRHTPAKIKFLSLEPLLDRMSLLRHYLYGIDWVIVGGESGPGAREMKPEWVREIRDICIDKNVKFFFKQWGGPIKKKTGRILDGETWDQFPVFEE
jgi:protein gp37